MFSSSTDGVQPLPSDLLPLGLCYRIIPCLDVNAEGRVVKGVKFQGLRDIGDPVEMAKKYQEEGADELVFLDISASHQNRKTLIDWVSRVAHCLMIPFTVGGGVKTLDDVSGLLQAGADKVAMNSAAVYRPELLTEVAQHAGSQCAVLAIDAKWTQHTESGWEVLTHGGKKPTGIDAIAWAKDAVARGAGEILLTSWDQDGMQGGFDLPLNHAVSQAVNVPVIASGGAASPDSFVEVFQQKAAQAALAASIFHDNHYRIAEVKEACRLQGIPMRHPS
ncbi:MAG: imidazole glycerol phosphate synthase subunit HisF [Vampirovibrionales bacterium]